MRRIAAIVFVHIFLGVHVCVGQTYTYTISGGLSPADKIWIDDDVTITVGGRIVLNDNDAHHNGDQWGDVWPSLSPVSFTAAPGEPVHIMARNVGGDAGLCALWAHVINAPAQQLFGGYPHGPSPLSVFVDVTVALVYDELDVSLGTSDTYVGDPVSSTGNFFHPVTDMVLSARGPLIVLSRIYNSVDTNAGPLGVGWHHAYLTRVETNGTGVVLVRQDAKRETYALTNGAYVIQGDAWSGDLWRTAEGWRFRDKANLDWQYGAEGALASVRDRNGNALALAWSAAGLLTNVADSVGRGVVFRYDGAGLLTNVADWAGRGVAYGYTNVGGLSCLGEVRDVRGFKTVYGYGAGGVLTTVTDANGKRTVENVYDDRWRVVSQTDALTNRTEIAY